MLNTDDTSISGRAWGQNGQIHIIMLGYQKNWKYKSTYIFLISSHQGDHAGLCILSYSTTTTLYLAYDNACGAYRRCVVSSIASPGTMGKPWCASQIHRHVSFGPCPHRSINRSRKIIWVSWPPRDLSFATVLACLPKTCRTRTVGEISFYVERWNMEWKMKQCSK